MDLEQKNWLVRRKTGEIIGPFTQEGLLEALGQQVFLPDDEICPSHGSWMSAEQLESHHVDELTQTSTRTQTETHQVDEPTESAIEKTEPQVPLAPTSQTPLSKKIQVPLKPNPAQPSAPTTGLKETGEEEQKEDGEKSPAGVRSKLLIVTLLFFAGWAAIMQLSHLLAPEQRQTARQEDKPMLEVEKSPFHQKLKLYVQTGRQEEALAELESYYQASKKNPEPAYKIMYASLLITKKKSLARASQMLKEVLESQAPAKLKAEAHHWLGYLDLSENQNELGINHFLEALQLNPNDGRTRYNIGRAYLKTKRYQESLKYLHLAEMELPSADKWLLHIYLGRAKASMGNYQDARIAFKTAVEMAQDRWLTYIYFSLFLKAIGENQEAQAVMTKMLSRDPHYEVNAPVPFGFFQEKTNYDEYLQSFNEVMKGAPADVIRLGKSYIKYLKKGPKSSGLKTIRNLASGSTDRAHILLLKASLDDPTIDKATLSELMKKLPSSLDQYGYYAYVLLGEAQVQLGQLENAQKSFHKALILEPKAAITRLAYAMLLKRMSRSHDAESELNYLLAYHPGYIPAIVASQNLR